MGTTPTQSLKDSLGTLSQTGNGFNTTQQKGVATAQAIEGRIQQKLGELNDVGVAVESPVTKQPLESGDFSFGSIQPGEQPPAIVLEILSKNKFKFSGLDHIIHQPGANFFTLVQTNNGEKSYFSFDLKTGRTTGFSSDKTSDWLPQKQETISLTDQLRQEKIVLADALMQLLESKQITEPQRKLFFKLGSWVGIVGVIKFLNLLSALKKDTTMQSPYRNFYDQPNVLGTVVPGGIPREADNQASESVEIATPLPMKNESSAKIDSLPVQPSIMSSDIAPVSEPAIPESLPDTAPQETIVETSPIISEVVIPEPVLTNPGFTRIPRGSTVDFIKKKLGQSKESENNSKPKFIIRATSDNNVYEKLPTPQPEKEPRPRIQKKKLIEKSVAAFLAKINQVVPVQKTESPKTTPLPEPVIVNELPITPENNTSVGKEPIPMSSVTKKRPEDLFAVIPGTDQVSLSA